LTTTAVRGTFDSIPFRANRTFHRGVLWSAELGQLDTQPPETHFPAEFGRLEESDLDRLLPVVGRMDPISPEAIAKRFRIGRQCFFAQVNGAIVAYGWLTRGSEYVGEFERELWVEADEAYVWDCATLPDYRRRRLFSKLLAYITDRARREGIQRLWIIGLTAAPGINRGVAAAGFRPLLSLAYLRLLDLCVLRLVPMPDSGAHHLAAAYRLLGVKQTPSFRYWRVSRFERHVTPETHFAGQAQR
jgi:GNAT superfamily N-acetyltransferase